MQVQLLKSQEPCTESENNGISGLDAASLEETVLHVHRICALVRALVLFGAGTSLCKTNNATTTIETDMSQWWWALLELVWRSTKSRELQRSKNKGRHNVTKKQQKTYAQNKLHHEH